jgi:hypothetical protein
MDKNAKYEARAEHSAGINSKYGPKMVNPKLEILNSKQTQIGKIQNSKEEQILGKRS